jgi:ribosome-binding protein aMBF1 (putative translation factor)
MEKNICINMEKEFSRQISSRHVYFAIEDILWREFSLEQRMGDFGARVQRLRKQKGLTMRQLEEQARIPHGIISRLERDHRAYPSIPVAMQLAKRLGVTLDYLCGMYEEERELQPDHVE